MTTLIVISAAVLVLLWVLAVLRRRLSASGKEVC